ncbi:putative RNA-dependent RNA polymerase [Festuca stripe-associated virus]|uniref:RNA-directed RNA polymerase L n=1 Tax=Festuca stripe-associated virus TaxID=2847287 RepID=A0A8F1N628_9VIRU|nr:putative RNA-dependent RNA polymerase [Festuca stripe-associated virus]
MTNTNNDSGGMIVHIGDKQFDLLGSIGEVESFPEAEEQDVPGDGFCLYHSLLASLGSGSQHLKTFMKLLRVHPVIHQLDIGIASQLYEQLDVRRPEVWGDQWSIALVSAVLDVKINVYQEVHLSGVNGSTDVRTTIYKCSFNPSGNAEIQLRNHGGLHFSSYQTNLDYTSKVFSKLEWFLRNKIHRCEAIFSNHPFGMRTFDETQLLGTSSFASIDDLLSYLLRNTYSVRDNGDLFFLNMLRSGLQRGTEKIRAISLALGFNAMLYSVFPRAAGMMYRVELDISNMGSRKITIFEVVGKPTRWLLKTSGGGIMEKMNFRIQQVVEDHNTLLQAFVQNNNYHRQAEVNQISDMINDHYDLVVQSVRRNPQNTGHELFTYWMYYTLIFPKCPSLLKDSGRIKPLPGSIFLSRLPTAFGYYDPEGDIFLLSQTGLVFKIERTGSVEVPITHSPSKVEKTFKTSSFPTETTLGKLSDYAPKTNCGFYHPNAEIYVSKNQKTPNIITTIEDNHIMVRLSKDDDGEHQSQTIRGDFIYRKKLSEAKNIIHDFVFDFLSSDTDMSLIDSGLGLGNDADRYTPDVIINREKDDRYKDVIAIEFTTRSTESRESLLRAVEVKSERYKEALQERSVVLKKNISFYTICVSLDAVATNLLTLPAEVCQELVLRLRAANQMKIQLGDNDINLEADTMLAPEVYRIKEMFRENFPNDKFTDPITVEMYEHFTNKISKSEYEYIENMQKKVNDAVLTDAHTQLTEIYDEGGKPYTDRKAEEGKISLAEKLAQYSSYFDDSNFKTTQKAPVQLPLIIPLPTDPTLTFNSFDLRSRLKNVEAQSIVKDIWVDALSYHNASKVTDHLDELEVSMLEREVATVVEEKYKKDRSSYNRTTFQCSIDEKIHLAQRGINAKKLLKDPEVKTYRDESKLPFHPFDSDTSDIVRFTQTECLELESKTDYCSMMMTEDLILTALELHDVGDLEFLWKNVKDHSQTRFALYAKFVSDLATELSISLSQNCKEDTFIVKKLRDFDCYLLIKPVNQKSNVHFSIFVPNNIYFSKNSTFKELIGEAENGFMTDFVSANVSKLVNWVRCEPMMMAQRGFWREFYSLAPSLEEQEGAESTIDVCRMMSWTLLILLNDKHQLEEMITISRFIHMEGFVTFPKWPNPSKMVDKLSITPRSRLECLIIKRMIMLMESYTESPIKFSVVDNNKKWHGFKNPFILDEAGKLSELSDQDQMLNLFYLGYLKNKDEEVEDNGMGQIITKILGFENQLPKDRQYLGMKDPPLDSVQKHEFSVSFVKLLCDNFLNRLKKNLNIRDPVQYLGDKIAKFLSTQFIETLASLKASSNFSEEYYLYKPNKRIRNQEMSHSPEVVDPTGNVAKKYKGKVYHRSKAIEKLTKIIRSEDPNKEMKLVVDLLPKAMEHLNASKCMHICIFKKNQHGGLREIYVLNIFERIMQKTVEDFARAILECCPSETMTSPKNKFKIPEQHNSSARKALGSDYFTIATSDDASKWSQGHYVSKFLCMLLRLTPKIYHGFLVQSLQLWHHKKIFLGDQLLTLFNQNSSLNTMDKAISQVFSAYKGKIQVPWMKPGRSYLEVETGMMQGILHYTSSLFHALFLDDLAENCVKDLNNSLARICPGENLKCIVNNMESSDDSSLIVSVPSFKDKPAKQLYIMAMVNAWFERKARLGLYLAIYKSPKSTTQTLFVMEFNSEFFFSGDVHRPTFRWVNAAILIGEQETLSGIQEELSNTLKDVVEGGGTYALTFMVQVAQAMTHYRMLGSSVAAIWPAFETLLKNSYDPALGFFLMDNPKCPGLMGFNYNVWLACTMTPLGEKYKDMIEAEMQSEKPSLKAVTEDTINTGLVSRTTVVGFGNKKRWLKLMNTLELTQDVYNKIEEEPRIYFFHAATAEQIVQKVAIKMKSPGVISSLSKGNILARKIASSAFYISRHIVFTMSAYYDVDPKTRKTSLIKELMRSSKLPERIITQNEAHTLIPETDNIIIPDFKEPLVQCVEILKDQLKISTEREDLSIPKFFSNYKKRITGTDLNPEDRVECLITLSSLLKFNYIIFRKKDDNQTFVVGEKNIVYPTIGRFVHMYEDDSNNALCYMKTHDHNKRRKTLTFDVDKAKDLEDILSLLFPSYADYLSLKETLDQVSFTSLTHQVNERRRVRADVHLTGTEGYSRLPMYAASIWAWFNVKTVAAHDNTYDGIWRYYQKKLPWMKDNLKDTITSGPYSTVQGLVNFISRDGVRSRVVHLVGSFGKNVRGSINLVTAIKDNYSNGIVFKGDIFDMKAKETREGLDNYLSIMTALSQAPIEVHDKNQILRSLLVKGPDIAHSASHFSSRRNRLSILQEIIKCDPDLHWLGQTTTFDMVKEKFMEMSNIEMPSLTLEQFSAAHEKVEKLVLEDQKLGGRSYSASKSPYVLARAADYEIHCYDLMLAYEYEDEEAHTAYMDEKEAVVDEKHLQELRRLFYEDPKANWINMVMEGSLVNIESIVEAKTSFNMRRQGMVERIRTGKLGVLGSYTQTQKPIETENGFRYHGEGIWRGSFDDTDISITMDSIDITQETYLKVVTLQKISDLKTTMAQLKVWCREHNINNDKYPELGSSDKELIKYGVTRRSLLVMKLSGFKMTKVSDDGIPIYWNPDLSTRSQTQINNLAIDITTHSVRLRNRVLGQKGFKEQTIMTIPLLKTDIQVFKTSPVDLEQDIQSDRMKLISFTRISEVSWLQDWIMWRSSPKDQKNILELIKRKKGFREYYKENHMFRTWLSNLWEYALEVVISHKKLVLAATQSSSSSNGSTQEGKETSATEVYDQLMELVDKDMTDDKLKSIIHEAHLDEMALIPYIEDILSEESEVFGYQLSQSHPLLVKYVRYMVSEIEFENFKNFIDSVKRKDPLPGVSHKVIEFKEVFKFIYDIRDDNYFRESEDEEDYHL